MKLNKVVLTALSLTTLATTAYCETYAVCIGVNDYPSPKDAAGNPFKDEQGNPVDNKLNGCVNDAKSYASLLQSKFGVKKENLKVLTDSQVTGTAFVDSVKWLIQSAKAGDHVFLQFSGHGSQIPNAEKASGKQSVIVLQDMKLVTSDFFKELGPILRQSGVSSTFLFDSCFAGGMDKDAGIEELLGLNLGVDFKKPLKVNRSRKPRRILQKNLIKPKKLDLASVTKSSLISKPRSFFGEDASTCFLFASSENETSADVSGPNIEAHGIFTLVLTAALQEEPSLPIGDTVSAIADLLKEKFKQTPSAEATSADRMSQSLLPL